MIQLLRQQALLVVLSGLVFFINLGNFALFNDDEPKDAACGAEMYRSGKLFVPTFNGELRTQHPILSYWFMFASYSFFGVSEFSARLTSAVMAVGTTLLTYHLGRMLYSARIGFLAGIVLCTCLLFSAYGRSAKPDSTMLLLVTFAFASYVWVVAKNRGGHFSGGEITDTTIAKSDAIATENQAETTNTVSSAGHPRLKLLVPGSWKFAIPMFAAMGLAVLTTGLAPFVLPIVTIVLFLLIALRSDDLETGALIRPEGSLWRRWKITLIQLFRPRVVLEVSRGLNLLIGIGIVAAIAIPWYLIVGFMTKGVWLQEFLWDHGVNQIYAADANQSGFPLYQLYYLVTVHIGCFPWSVFLPVAVYQLRRRLEDGAAWRDSDRLVACWAVIWFVVFSLMGTRTPHYVLPMYPAVALILARYFHDWELEEVDSGVYSFNICLRALGIAGAVVTVGLTVTSYVYFSSAQWTGLIGIIPAAASFVAIKFLDKEQRNRVILTLIATAASITVLLIGVAPASLVPHQDSKLFVTEARKFAGTKEIEIATYRDFDPNIVFYTGKKVTLIETPREAADFVAANPSSFLIAPAAELNDLRNELFADVRELSRHRRFMHGGERILLGRDRSSE